MIPNVMAKAALALPFSGIYGSLGNTSIVQRPDGPVVRARVYKPRKPTPAQAAAGVRLTLIGEAWHALDLAVFYQWHAFARASRRRNPATGASVVPQTYGLFVKHASKVMQIDPRFDFTGFAPPALPFTGDAVRVEFLPASGPLPLTLPGATLPLRDASSQEELLGEGVLTLLASRANAPGVVTEILAQPLVNARRAVYKDKYVSQGFVVFAGADEVEIPLGRGAWALAYRFVERATGQATELVALGVATVG